GHARQPPRTNKRPSPGKRGEGLAVPPFVRPRLAAAGLSRYSRPSGRFIPWRVNGRRALRARRTSRRRLLPRSEVRREAPGPSWAARLDAGLHLGRNRPPRLSGVGRRRLLLPIVAFSRSRAQSFSVALEYSESVPRCQVRPG